MPRLALLPTAAEGSSGVSQRYSHHPTHSHHTLPLPRPQINNTQYYVRNTVPSPQFPGARAQADARSRPGVTCGPHPRPHLRKHSP